MLVLRPQSLLPQFLIRPPEAQLPARSATGAATSSLHSYGGVLDQAASGKQYTINPASYRVSRDVKWWRTSGPPGSIMRICATVSTTHRSTGSQTSKPLLIANQDRNLARQAPSELRRWFERSCSLGPLCRAAPIEMACGNVERGKCA
jgi:hypothetical protein